MSKLLSLESSFHMCDSNFSVTGTGSDLCMGYSDCTTSCPEASLKNCKDSQKYINGVCKIYTGGCICQPGLVGATCNRCKYL